MRRFTISDLEEVNSWYVSHGLPTLNTALLPSVGVIVPDVAAGFLYRTDSALGFIEGLVTNPHAKSEDRNQALDQIIDALIGEAKEHGIRQLVGMTKVKRIEERAHRHGFKSVGYYSMVVLET